METVARVGFAATPAVLSYDTTDPLAVTMRVSDGVSWVEWLFARDLLDVGIYSDEPMGIGDVQVWHNAEDDVVIRLVSPEGVAVLALPLDDVEEFLCESFCAVPLGDEKNFMRVSELDDLLREWTE
jgi:hypothetical protein